MTEAKPKKEIVSGRAANLAVQVLTELGAVSEREAIHLLMRSLIARAEELAVHATTNRYLGPSDRADKLARDQEVEFACEVYSEWYIALHGVSPDRAVTP